MRASYLFIHGFNPISQAIYTCYSAFVLCGIHYGTGQHIQDLTPENAMTAKTVWEQGTNETSLDEC
jgi:hypothetical protein